MTGNDLQQYLYVEEMAKQQDFSIDPIGDKIKIDTPTRTIARFDTIHDVYMWLLGYEFGISQMRCKNKYE